MRQYFTRFADARASKRQELSASGQPTVGDHLPNKFELAGNDDYTRQIARMSSDFVALFKRSGTIDDCSLSSGHFHSLAADDLLAGGFMERLHITERPAFLATLDRVCHEGEDARIELRLRCPSSQNIPDHFRWIEMNCSLLEPHEDASAEHQPDQRPVLCVARDITQIKQREDELIALEQTAREMLDSKNRSFTNMSHALRTPLNAIIGFSEMMQHPGVEAGFEQKMQEYAGIIHDSGRHLLGVVDEVFDMSQFDAGRYRLDPQVYRVADLVAAALELVQFEAEARGVRLANPAIDETLEIRVDSRACKQALAGALAIAISAAQKDSREKVLVAINARADRIEFAITVNQTGSDESLKMPGGQSQLQAFVDLLSGSLRAGRNAAGQNELVVELPSGLVTGARTDNIVAIDNQSPEICAPVRKSA